MTSSRAGILRRGTAAALLLLAACGAPLPDGPRVEAADAWANATASGMDAADPHAAHHGGSRAAAYLTLRNRGSEADRVVGVESPASAHAEIHLTLVEEGIARMRPVAGVDILPGETLEMRPGGYHVMLLELHRPLVAGERVPLRLRLERGGELEVEAEVRAP
jgi:periplasmic copper chaperone A